MTQIDHPDPATDSDARDPQLRRPTARVGHVEGMNAAYANSGEATEFERGGQQAEAAPRGYLARLGGKLVFWSAMIVGPVILIAALVLGAAYFRLQQGPVSLSFLAEPIAAGIRASFEDLTPDISDVVVKWTDADGFEVRLQDLKLRDSAGSIVASAPSAAVELATGSLWRGEIVPSRVDLIQPRLFFFYSQDKGLSLSFSADPDDTTPPELIQPPEIVDRDAIAAGTAPPPAALTPPRRLDLARALSEAAARARGQGGGGLREVGLRDATVVLDYEGHRSVWQVPTLSVDVEHTGTRSVMSGNARIGSDRGPWSLSFRAEASGATGEVVLRTSIRDLVPRTVADAHPSLSIFQALDLPIATDTELKLASTGDIKTAEIAVELANGRFQFPALVGDPLDVQAGLVAIVYDAERQMLEVRPSTVKWGGRNALQFGGAIAARKLADGRDVWPFELKALDGVFSGDEFGLPDIPVENWVARGQILPQEGILQLANLDVTAGGGSIRVEGDIDVAAETQSARLQGEFNGMPLATLKTLWPRGLAPGARKWVGERVVTATISGSTFRHTSGRYFAEEQPGTAGQTQRTSLAVEISDLLMQPLPEMAAIAADRALLSIENNSAEVAIPTAEMRLDDGQSIAIKSGRFYATNLDQTAPAAVVEFTVRSTAAPIIEVLDKKPLAVFDDRNRPPEGLKGKVDGTVKLAFPLLNDLVFDDVRITAQAKLRQGRANNVIGKRDIAGASLDFDITDKAVAAKGSVVLSGVVANVAWQKVYDAPPNEQAPLRVSATLDSADRKALGLDLDGLISGDVPVELTIKETETSARKVTLRADLTPAELALPTLGWRKPVGRSAILDGDIVTDEASVTTVKNLKIRGPNVAIEGSISLNKNQEATAFSFPTVSLDVVTQMAVKGERRGDGIWQINADGPTLDGRPFFRSLFSAQSNSGRADRGAGADGKRRGVDITARIKTIIGYHEQSMTGFQLQASKRGDEIVALDASGTLQSGQPLKVQMRRASGDSRQVLADSTDAGRAFKLVGFYPNVNGGRVRLEVNLDGSGDAEKTGILWVERFQIFGDPIVQEVVDSAGKNTELASRPVFDFDRMKAPFSVGHDQFVLKDSYLRGPLLGATLRGKVDYRSKQLNLGGTYIPLQGLNNMLGEIPLLGALLSGPRKEGIFGMTFGIQGAMSNPQVLVNPLSFVAPGIFREIFALTPQDPKVRPRGPRAAPTGGDGARVRSYSRPADAGAAAAGGRQSPQLDGWNSQTTRQ